MSAPYWGELPASKVAQSRHGRRPSEASDYSNADRRPSLDIQPTRRKRASVQTANTANTEAPTESTFSPAYDSPTASSFAPQGLAPRPTTYQHHQSGHRNTASDNYEKRHRQRTRHQEEFDEPPSATPPAAPEVPRAPPVSYRHPYGNGGLPYTVPVSETTAPPIESHPAFEDDMDPNYQSRGSGRAGSQDYGPAPTEHRRVASGPSGRRRKFADDRSPLQRLELTLDSITKEEKRARVEAAEQRARQRAARADQEAIEQQQVRFHDRQPSTSHGKHRVTPADAAAAATTAKSASVSRKAPPPDEDYSEQYTEPYTEHYTEPYAEPTREAPREVPREAPRETRKDKHRDAWGEAPREAPVHREQSTRHRGPLTQHPPDEGDYYGSGALPDPDESYPVQKTAVLSSEVPKRNLSFRERAARSQAQRSSLVAEQSAPVEQSPEVHPPPAATSSGFSLTRSGSNKLKKDPPPEYRYQRMPEPEKRDAPVSRRQPPREEPQPPPSDVIYHSPRERGQRSDPKDGRFLPQHEHTRASPDPDHDHIYTRGTRSFKRRATEPAARQDYDSEPEYVPPTTKGKSYGKLEKDLVIPPQEGAAARRRKERADSFSSEDSHHHRVSNMVFKRPEDMAPGNGLYKPPVFLEEWKKGTVGTLGGNLLDVHESHAPAAVPDQNKAWWEKDGRQGNHPYGTRPRKAEAFDGEYDENAPTRFKPPLYMKCGPLLRYCGLRKEKVPTRTPRGTGTAERELWRGSVMIVTLDADSSYEIAPTLRLFVQDLELLPPPPHKVKGDLSPEYVDPIAGHPKLGRRGETLYVRPVEHLEESKDLSRDETDEGLFEQSRSPPDVTPPNGEKDLPGSFASRRKRVGIDGEKVQKYKDVRGFRLHAERGCTFWRFNIEVELREKQQRIAYRINRGPATGFWVPARGQTMNMMFYSCNGFSLSVKTDELSGPDPMWRDVLNNHQTQPFHLMIGGGDQIYNDCVADDCKLFGEWLDLRNPVHKHTAALTKEMQDELETFYLDRYSMWFSQGLFGLATSQIPMVNMYDDHDIFDGYGSYPHHYMNSPVFCGLGAMAFKYYMLFQHQTVLNETEATEPSWILGEQPGPYIGELSRSLFMQVGSRVALLAVDARMERTEHDVVSDKTWEKIMNRLYAEVRRGQVEHLLVLLGVPIAYPRLVWLENILTSRLMNPVKALGRTGMFGKLMNNIDGGVEVLDDLNDHWTAKNHKQERSIVIEDLQDLAIDKSLRVTILSGDVHLAAVGRFYSNPKLGLPKHKDPRYMPNIISSAIANTPPPDLMADVLNKRNKVHHFDKQTDEDMIPMFPQGVDGKPRNNKHLLPHRNWCSIREWAPGTTPPPTPPSSSHGRSPSPPPRPVEKEKVSGGGAGGLFRKLSLSKSRPVAVEQTPDQSRDSVRGPRPPVARSGSLFRSWSRRGSNTGEKPAKLTRSMSVDRGGTKKPSFFSFGRINSQRRPQDDDGVHDPRDPRDQRDPRADDSESDDYWYDRRSSSRPRPSGLRGGAAHDEYYSGDESYFTARPPARAHTIGTQAMSNPQLSQSEGPPTRPFYRTPTGLSTKQKRKPEKFEVDLEGGLDICLNVEVSAKDPAGITIPYRLLVPKLFYEYDPADDVRASGAARKAKEAEDTQESAAGSAPALAPAPAQPSAFKRLLSFKKKPPKVRQPLDDYDSEEEYQERPSFQQGRPSFQQGR